MKPIDSYDLAVSLAPQVSTEAEHRTVVGRLYYGLHHEVCCRYFRENPNSPPLPRFRRHTELHRRLNSPSDVRSQRVAQHLYRLKVLRTIADYELGALSYANRPLTSNQLMALALQSGQRLLQALEAYSPGEAPDGCSCPTQ